jgi:trk system potassium uptake protein TrkA
LGESRPRSKHGITIVGVKRAGEDFTHATPETVVEAGDIIIVSGPQSAVERFSELT